MHPPLPHQSLMQEARMKGLSDGPLPKPGRSCSTPDSRWLFRKDTAFPEGLPPPRVSAGQTRFRDPQRLPQPQHSPGQRRDDSSRSPLSGPGLALGPPPGNHVTACTGLGLRGGPAAQPGSLTPSWETPAEARGGPCGPGVLTRHPERAVGAAPSDQADPQHPLALLSFTGRGTGRPDIMFV